MELLQQVNGDESVHKDQRQGIPCKNKTCGTEVADMDRLSCKFGEECCKEI